MTNFLLLSAAALTIWFLAEKSKRRTHPVTGGAHPEISLPHACEFELYAHSLSHCSRKVQLVMAELGLPYRFHPVHLIETGSYQTLSPAYLKINPSGLVPTLVHDGHPVYESDDILAYAQRVAGADAPRLIPADADARAEMEAWLRFLSLSSANPIEAPESRAGSCIAPLSLPLFAVAIHKTAYFEILKGLLFHPDRKRPLLFLVMKAAGLRIFRARRFREALRANRDHMARHLLKIEAALALRPWLGGDQMSLADVSLACLLLRLDEVGWLAHFMRNASLPQTGRYHARWKTRRSWREAIAAHAHPRVAAAIVELGRLQVADADVRDAMFGTS